MKRCGKAAGAPQGRARAGRRPRGGRKRRDATEIVCGFTDFDQTAYPAAAKKAYW